MGVCKWGYDLFLLLHLTSLSITLTLKVSGSRPCDMHWPGPTNGPTASEGSF